MLVDLRVLAKGAGLKIKDIRLEAVSLPSTDAKWRISSMALPTYDGVLITLTTEDGSVGEGYSFPFPPLGETPGGCKNALEIISRKLIGHDALAIQANMDIARKAIPGNHAAKSGLDCAMHDLLARVLKVPLYQVLGGKTRSSIPLMRIMALKSPSEMRDKAIELTKEGYRYLKLKLAGAVAEDVERVKMVREAVGKDVHLSLDPNMAFRAKDAINFCQRVEEFGITMMEQPVPDGNWLALEHVTRATSIAIEADESATTVEQVMDLAAYRRVDGINLKVPRSGGILNVMTMARICGAAGLSCRLGANVGTRLLTAHAVHVGAAIPNLDHACELAEFERLGNDPYEGLTIKNGEIIVPDEVGSGVQRRAH